MAVRRLPGVLAVLYLLFTRGYDADGEPAFAAEAIRLTRLLERLMPGRAEISALLALFLFQHSRGDARRDAEGNLLTLDRQDRRRWDHAAIAEGLHVLATVRENGPYALQARIAACHATAASFDDTDWLSIATWYDELVRRQPTPVIRLNRAVAHGYACRGPVPAGRSRRRFGARTSRPAAPRRRTLRVSPAGTAQAQVDHPARPMKDRICGRPGS